MGLEVQKLEEEELEELGLQKLSEEVGRRRSWGSARALGLHTVSGPRVQADVQEEYSEHPFLVRRPLRA